MRFILLSALVLTHVVAQNVTIYPEGPKLKATDSAATPATPAASANPTPSSTHATASQSNPAGSTTSPAAVPPAAADPAATPAAPAGLQSADADAAPATIPGETEYTVVSGDSLWRISRKMHVTVESIKALNQLPNNNLKIGSVLRIPPPLAPKVKTPKGKKITAEVHHGANEVPLSSGTASPLPPPPPPSLQDRLTTEIKQIASNKIAYNHDWIPPGENQSWTMDCSNTSRWLLKKVENVEIPRTASDQYDSLMKEHKAWLAPRLADGRVDTDTLAAHLQAGDLLFWENTYKPERNVPVTHVAVYLGKDDQGRMIMAASQSSRGFFNPAGSGPDVYLFDPNAPTGGYNTGWFGWTHVKGRFAAYGRPVDTSVAPPPKAAAATSLPTTSKVPALVRPPN